MNYLRELLSYWASQFDWYEQENKLNQLPHFLADINGTQIHFIHVKAKDGKGIPLIFTHGWPSTFIEMISLIPFLTDPTGHQIERPSFDLIIPSLPGYGFSGCPL